MVGMGRGGERIGKIFQPTQPVRGVSGLFLLQGPAVRGGIGVMRTAWLLRWGIGTAAALAALGAVGGCGVSSSGASDVRASQSGIAGGGGKTLVIVASRSTPTSIAFAATSSTNAANTTAAHTKSATATDATISTPTPRSTSATFVSTSAALNPSTATVSACTTADLNLQVFEPSPTTPSGHARTPVVPIGPGLGALHGIRTQQLTLVFTNVSHSACIVSGFPSVDFLRAGVQGPLSAPDSFSRTTAVPDVRLSPGSAARASITFTTNSYANSRGSRCDEAVAVRAYLPGSVKALVSGARDGANHRIQYFYVCGPKVIVEALQPK
jgi:Protein of unknown function (DUF4232)